MNLIQNPKFTRHVTPGAVFFALKRKPAQRAHAKVVESDGLVYAYPHGEGPEAVFSSIKSAHAYLLLVGSKSPWVELKKMHGDE